MNYIENIAEKVLDQAGITELPIKADHIAEFICDLEFKWLDLDKLSSNGIVLAVISFGEGKIYLNKSKELELKNNLGRLNFTLAHELGHWFLHKDLSQEILPGFEEKILICRGINVQTDRKEREANIFAAYLLMPEKLVVDQLKFLKYPLNEYDLKQIANTFRVSKQALEIRLVDELRLLHYANNLYYKSELEALEANGQLSLF